MHTALTQEQTLILKAFTIGETFKVNAYAGTGKTFTLRALAEANPQRRFLYVGFNRRIVDEAQLVFPQGYVSCKTAHQLAYARTPDYVRERVTADTQDLLKTMTQWVQTSTHLGKLTDVTSLCETLLMPALQQFKQSDLLSMPAQKSLYPEEAWDTQLSQRGVQAYLRHLGKHPQCAKKLALSASPHTWEKETFEALALLGFQKILSTFWHAQFSPESTLPIDHDAYLKAWQLTQPKLSYYDAILFDEAQDANPCMLNVVMTQTHCQKVIVGDRFQQLYAWRGAINSLKTLQIPEYYLTQTFRFGNTLADLATQVLHSIDPETPPLTSALQPSIAEQATVIRPLHTEEFPRTVLCRTNAALLNDYLQYYETCHIDIVGREAYAMASELEGHFKACKRLDASGWKYLKQETKDSAPQSYNLMVWVEKNQARIPEVLKHLKQAARKNKTASKEAAVRKVSKRPFVLLSTVHQAKGLEWDYVVLGDDFKVDTPDELNILYVALTRAKRAIDVSACSALSLLGCMPPECQTMAGKQIPSYVRLPASKHATPQKELPSQPSTKPLIQVSKTLQAVNQPQHKPEYKAQIKTRIIQQTHLP